MDQVLAMFDADRLEDLLLKYKLNLLWKKDKDAGKCREELFEKYPVYAGLPLLADYLNGQNLNLIELNRVVAVVETLPEYAEFFLGRSVDSESTIRRLTESIRATQIETVLAETGETNPVKALGKAYENMLLADEELLDKDDAANSDEAGNEMQETIFQQKALPILKQKGLVVLHLADFNYDHPLMLFGQDIKLVFDGDDEVEVTFYTGQREIKAVFNSLDMTWQIDNNACPDAGLVGEICRAIGRVTVVLGNQYCFEELNTPNVKVRQTAIGQIYKDIDELPLKREIIWKEYRAGNIDSLKLTEETETKFLENNSNPEKNNPFKAKYFIKIDGRYRPIQDEEYAQQSEVYSLGWTTIAIRRSSVDKEIMEKMSDIHRYVDFVLRSKRKNKEIMITNEQIAEYLAAVRNGKKADRRLYYDAAHGCFRFLKGFKARRRQDNPNGDKQVELFYTATYVKGYIKPYRVK